MNETYNSKQSSKCPHQTFATYKLRLVVPWTYCVITGRWCALPDTVIVIEMIAMCDFPEEGIEGTSMLLKTAGVLEIFFKHKMFVRKTFYVIQKQEK